MKLTMPRTLLRPLGPDAMTQCRDLARNAVTWHDISSQAAVTICYHLARFHHCLPGQPSPPPPFRTRLRRRMACCGPPLEAGARPMREVAQTMHKGKDAR